MPQSTWQAITDRIVAQLGTITGIGRVWNRTRLGFDESSILGFATDEIGGEQKLRLWMVHLEVPAASKWSEAGGHAQWDRNAVIEGFLQVEDEDTSELAAIALGESVIRTLNTDVRTTRLGETVLWGGPATFPNGHRPGQATQFAFVVCHYVVVHLPVHTLESP
jgi:hypothetical protein